MSRLIACSSERCPAYAVAKWSAVSSITFIMVCLVAAELLPLSPLTLVASEPGVAHDRSSLSSTSIVTMSYAEANRTGGSATVPVHELPPALDLAVALIDTALAVGVVERLRRAHLIEPRHVVVGELEFHGAEIVGELFRRAGAEDD